MSAIEKAPALDNLESFLKGLPQIAADCVHAKAPTRKSIEDLQAAAAKLPQAVLHTEHYFADGMYCRALYRPADTLIIGKVHKKEHLYLVMSGEVTVISDGHKERIKAPRIIVSKPGTKRAVYAHVDSLCITVHRTDETDLDKIEAQLIEPDETAMFDSHNRLKAAEPLALSEKEG